MGRKNKEGLSFIPVDVDIFTDEKILLAQEIIDPLGKEPFLRFCVPYIAIRVLTRVYSNGYYTEWNQQTCLKMVQEIGNGITYSILENIIKSFTKVGFLDANILEKHGIITSHGIQKRWYSIIKSYNRVAKTMRKDILLFYITKKTAKNSKKQKSEGIDISSQEIGISSEEIAIPCSESAISLSTTTIISNIDNKGKRNSNKNTSKVEEEAKNVISSQEIAITSQEINKSEQEIANSGKEKTKSGKEIGISSEEIDISYQETNKKRNSHKKNKSSDMNIKKTYEVGEFIDVYFTSPKYSQTREQLAMKSYITIAQLREYAEKFNEFLITGGKFADEETGKTMKQEDDWTSHFIHWLPGAINRSKTKAARGKTILPVKAIDSAIKFETDEAKKLALQKEKYAKKPTRLK